MAKWMRNGFNLEEAVFQKQETPIYVWYLKDDKVVMETIWEYHIEPSPHRKNTNRMYHIIDDTVKSIDIDTFDKFHMNRETESFTQIKVESAYYYSYDKKAITKKQLKDYVTNVYKDIIKQYQEKIKGIKVI